MGEDLARVVRVAGREPALVLRVEGEVDLSNAETVGTQIARLAAEGPGRTVLDLTPVEYLDSSGLRMVTGLCSSLRDDGALRIVAPGGSVVRRVFDLAALPVDLEESLAEALRGLGGERA
jgi:anti-anti-sigma factor